MPTPIEPQPRAWITCKCGARWTGNTPAHCAGCHQTFTGLSSFERHRRNSQCVIPGLVGLVPRLRRTGFVAWGLPGTWQPEN